MRNKFDEQLALLNTELIQMGALCEEAISKAAKALEAGDPALAEQVKPLEGEIDQMERDIETLCLKLLLQLPHQRDAVVGNLPDVLSDEKRRHRRAVFERPLFSDPIFRIAKVHSQWESKSWKIHQKFSPRKIDDYFNPIY